MRLKTESLIFRAIVLTTLCFVAGIFTLNQQDGTNHQKNEINTNPSAPEISAPKAFGAKLIDDPTAFFTAALALLTFVLAGVGVVQIYFLRRADATTSKTAEAALKSALAAERALEGADAPFISIIPKINAVKHHIIGGRISLQFMDGNKIIKYRLTNYGKSPALVLEIYKGLLVSRAIPEPTSFPPPQTNLFRVQFVGPNKKTPKYFIEQIETIAAGGDERLNWATSNFNNTPLWLVFQVRYRDALGAQFVSCHTFAFNSILAEFYAQGGTNHNYRRKLTAEEQAAMEIRDAH